MTNNLKQTLIEQLQQGERTVTFTKKDGTTRIMRCTLEPAVLPKRPLTEDKITTNITPDGNLAVWDLDVKAWRSFVVDSVVSCN